MSDKERGLYQKYTVQRLTGRPVKWAFVLEDTDPLTPFALAAYASAARERGYHALADDLKAKAREIEDALAPQSSEGSDQ